MCSRLTDEVRAARAAVLQAANEARPERFVRKMPFLSGRSRGRMDQHTEVGVRE